MLCGSSPWAPIIRARFAGHNSASCFFPTRTRPRPFLPQAQDQISRCLATSRIPCPRVAAFHGRLKDTRTVAQTAKVTEHAPRGRDTSRNSLVPLGASESPRLALGPAVSVPRYLAPHDRAWQARSWHESGPRQLHDRLGFLAVPRLWGLPDSPQAQAVGFPTHTHRYSESPYGSSPARFPASICSAAWDRLRT